MKYKVSIFMYGWLYDSAVNNMIYTLVNKHHMEFVEKKSNWMTFLYDGHSMEEVANDLYLRAFSVEPCRVIVEFAYSYSPNNYNCCFTRIFFAHEVDPAIVSELKEQKEA